MLSPVVSRGSVIAALLLVSIGVLPVDAQPFETGTTVPALEVEEMLAGPEPAALSGTLGSEAVVLEMWATWCGPCVAAIRHWNEMVDELAGQPVRFVSITDEDADRVGKFLERRPIAGWLALDTDRSIFDQFGIRGIPRTILIDAEGRMQGMAHPNHVTAETVRALLAGRPLGLPERSDDQDELAVDSEGRPAPLFETVLRPATGQDMVSRMGSGFYTAEGLPVGLVIPFAWSARSARLVVEAELPDQRYDLVIRTGGTDVEVARTVAQLVLRSAFGLVAAEENRELDVWILRRLQGTEPKLTPAMVEGGSMAQLGSLTALSVTTGRLAEMLEGVLDRPVFDETGLEGRWEVELDWQEGDPESLLAAVRETLGLDLQPARREVTVTVVRQREDRDPEAKVEAEVVGKSED